MRTFVDWSEGDVVVEELGELHREQGVPGVQVRHVLVDLHGHFPRGRQRVSPQALRPGLPDACHM